MYEQLNFREIRFVSWNKLDSSKKEEFIADCKEIDRLLGEATFTFKRNSILAGRLLRKLELSEIHKYVCRTDSSFESYKELYSSDSFYKFCERYFNLSKSTVYALMNVYSYFGDDDGSILPGYKKFNYSQLVEMCSMPVLQREQVTPDMTIKEIRALKKSSNKEQTTSPSSAESDKSTVQLTIKTPTLVFKDIKKAKERFKTLLKQMFEKFEYKLTLCNRRQAAQIFGGSLFDFLYEEGFFYDDE